MSVAKHTPGPWKAERTRLAREAGGGYYHRIFGNNDLVAETAKAGAHDREAMEADAADARLIAAAPDLLAALREVLSDGVSVVEQPTLDMIRAAIASAEGGYK